MYKSNHIISIVIIIQDNYRYRYYRQLDYKSTMQYLNEFIYFIQLSTCIKLILYSTFSCRIPAAVNIFEAVELLKC